MRRRALLSAIKPNNGDRPPESTVFEFPLYLNTQIVFEEEGYVIREGTRQDIALEWLNWVGEKYGAYCDDYIPKEDLINYPVFIDGHQVQQAWVGYGNIEQILTDYEYNDEGENWSELVIGVDVSYGLWVECYK